MPKAEPHFDAAGLIEAVHQQDFGLKVSTNNPSQFKQIIYTAARRLGLKVHIFALRGRPNSFALMPKVPEGLEPTEESQGE